MAELIKTFHIDIKLIIAQFVNFSIVLFVLYKFAYGPILKALNNRTEKIAEGLKNAEDAKKKLQEMEIKEKEVLTEARKEAQMLIESAEETAKKNKEEFLNETKKKADEILASTQRQLEDEKKTMISEIKSEVADLVVSATGKIIDEKMDSEKDKELIERSIK